MSAGWTGGSVFFHEVHSKKLRGEKILQALGTMKTFLLPADTQK